MYFRHALLHNGVCLSYVSIRTYLLMDAWDALVMSSKRLKVRRENSVGVIGCMVCVACWPSQKSCKIDWICLNV